jgi:hypothetical protein
MAIVYTNDTNQAQIDKGHDSDEAVAADKQNAAFIESLFANVLIFNDKTNGPEIMTHDGEVLVYE